MIAAAVFRSSARDAWVLAAGLAHGAALPPALALAAAGGAAVKAAVALIIGLAHCWGANTVSHIHLHGPLFRAEAANRAFSVYLTVLLAVPQTWWKLRHLAHHGACARTRLGPAGWLEIGAIVIALGAFAALAPALFAGVYLPALLLGFGLCAIQGRQEHARSDAGVDHHGRLYNRLWFNDGFHAAHHRAPSAHWTHLPTQAAPGDVTSPLPPVARWLEALPALANLLAAGFLDRLERATLGSPLVRRFLVATHRRAWVALLPPAERARVREVLIVGGGLFPRSALVLAELLPRARLTIVEAVPAHAARAAGFLEGVAPGRVRLVNGVYAPAEARADLVVVPLAFRGDRAALYRRPPARLVAVHDYIWRDRGDRGVVVSWWLFKRLNLSQRRE
jgi:hypothetical protein